MRWLMNVVKAVLVLAVVLAVTGLLLPGKRHVERSVDVAATPSQVWPLIAEPRRWTAWSPWYAKDPAMTLTYGGADSGAGAYWAWASRTQGRGRIQFERATPPRHLVYTLAFEDMGAGAVGEFRLEPLGTQGTRVTWSFDTDLGLNPVARWFGLGMERIVGPDFERGLAQLAAQFKSR